MESIFTKRLNIYFFFLGGEELLIIQMNRTLAFWERFGEDFHTCWVALALWS